MIHIGLSRWFAEFSRKPAGHGEFTLTIQLSPEACRYRVVEAERTGTRINLIEKEVNAETEDVRTTVDIYGLSAKRELEYWHRLADEVASNAVNQCISSGIVNYREYDKASGIYLVRHAIMRAIFSGASNEREEFDCVDLTPEMIARESLTLDERIARLTAQAAENDAQRHQDEELRLKRAEVRSQENERLRLAERERLRSAEERRAAAREANYRSYDLLESLLSSDELAGFQRTRVITIKTPLGEFRLREMSHGGVDRYVDGFYQCSYCVVFAEDNLPLGDNLAMKVALLKTDPERLIRTANQYIRPRRRTIFPYLVGPL